MIIETIKPPGNINAAHVAYIYDRNGVNIGICMDTPNNSAYAFLINPEAAKIETPFNGTFTRENLKGHFYGLDAKYHKKYVKYF